jgi:hypothetical protein
VLDQRRGTGFDRCSDLISASAVRCRAITAARRACGFTDRV